MLVLSRKKDETIVINGSIKVTIVEIRGDKVRLGIEAPRDVVVHREEVLNAIEQAQTSPLFQNRCLSKSIDRKVA
ncbi:MAG: carbon storage regulator CsrA [Planctomycetota bacterium]|nr:carbon storage regulator CsrA [Planctomycetota bacterium]